MQSWRQISNNKYINPESAKINYLNSNKIECNQNISITPTNSSTSQDKVFNLQTNVNGLWMNPYFSSGSWNPMVGNGDKGIIFSSSSKETGNLVIGPWSDYQKGIKIVGSTGNIGINNANPTETLDVSGNAIIRGNLNITGNANPTETLDVSGNAIIRGNLNITGIVNFSQTFDSVYTPFTNGWNASLGVAGTGQAYTINAKIQTSDPTTISYTSGQPITNFRIVGCAMNLTAGVTYTGLALYFTAVGTSARIIITIYNSGGIGQSSSSSSGISIPNQTNRPMGFNLATPFTPTTSGIYFVCYQISSSTTTSVGAIPNNMINWQTPSVGGFNLRSGYFDRTIMGVFPNLSTVTLTKWDYVPYIALY